MIFLVIILDTVDKPRDDNHSSLTITSVPLDSLNCPLVTIVSLSSTPLLIIVKLSLAKAISTFLITALLSFIEIYTVLGR
ncbi:MAG TPA: hypothetical protein LFW21_06960 [Rickettsia endosymbiont of Pyrocoelia pectoralis]|nr:hypothetical protein [Rickettsia endosymbiont of Pyrocoelia pectoralis]